MPDLEDRVTSLEARVDALEVDARHGVELALTSGREALAAREARQQNVRLLNATRETQSGHGQRLDSVEARLTSVEAKLDAIDGRVGGVEDRVGAVDGKLGTLTVGMHTIEGLLRRLVDEGS